MRNLVDVRGRAGSWIARRGSILALVVLLGACSGRVETGGGEAGSGAASPEQSDAGGGSGLTRHALGPCSPGFLRSAFPGRACNWLSESGQCFDSSDQACNCICPGQGNSICSNTGYGGPGSASPIYCDKL